MNRRLNVVTRAGHGRLLVLRATLSGVAPNHMFSPSEGAA